MMMTMMMMPKRCIRGSTAHCWSMLENARPLRLPNVITFAEAATTTCTIAAA